MALAFLLLATNVTFSAPAARVENLLPSLAAKLGKKMEVSPECRDEVLLIDVKDVDESLLMKKIAEAADAEWQTKPDGTLILIRPAATVSRERNSSLAERAAEIKTLQTELRTRTDGLPAFDQREAQLVMDAFRQQKDIPSFSPPRGGGPGNRLAARILAHLPAVDIAAMRDGDRLVYAARPTPWQRAVPGGIERDLAQFARDQDVWVATAGGGERGDGPVTNDDPVMSANSGRPPFSLRIVLSRYSDLAPGAANVTVLDRNGRPFLQSQASLTSKGMKNYLAPRVPGELWQLPPDGAAWGAATDLNYRGGTLTAPNEIKDKVVRPDKFEPLSFVVGPALVETARRRGHGIVANLPDILMGEIEVRGDRVDLNAVERKLATHAVRHDDSGPIELVVPGDPLRARADRVDRHALATLASAVRSTGMVRLDDLAVYAVSTPTMTRGWDGMSFYTIRVLLPRAERLVQFEDGRFLRLYGSLTPAQRMGLRNGQIAGMALSPGAKSALQDLVLNGGLQPTYTNAMRGLGPYDAQIALDPTSLLPSSGVSSLTISGTSQTSPALIAGSPEKDDYAAWTHVLTGGPNVPLVALEGSELWPGQVETISLQIGMNGVSWQGTLRDHRVRMDGPPTPPEKLPDGLRPTFRPFKPQ